MAARAVAITYRILEEEGLVDQVARNSVTVIQRLEDMARRERIREVRGLGYLLGVECRIPAREVRDRLLREGILVGVSYEKNTFRLLPPLTVGEAEWERFFEALEKICA